MNTLKQISDNTYYIKGFTNIGIYDLGDNEVCVIDTGMDDNAAQSIQEALIARNWKPAFILNTHYHADHVGGNHYLQDIYHCNAYSAKSECMLSDDTNIATSLLYGGNPPSPMREKLLQAQPSMVIDIENLALPKAFEIVHLDGHSISMLGFKTPDNVWFVADSVISEKIINTNHITYNYSVSKYIESLNTLQKLSGEMFVPSHAEPIDNLTNLIAVNYGNTLTLIDEIQTICRIPKITDDIFKALYDKWNLTISFQAYSVIGSALRNLLTYMYQEKLIDMEMKDNKLLWKVK